MRKFELQPGDWFLSDDLVCVYVGLSHVPEEEFERRLSTIFYGREYFRKYIELYGQLVGLDKFALLEAHGKANGEWLYTDGGVERPVQRLIDENDGEYSALLLSICNPGSHTPKSKKSILMVPDYEVGLVRHAAETSYTLLVPKVGEIDLYTVEFELEQIREKLNE